MFQFFIKLRDYIKYCVFKHRMMPDYYPDYIDKFNNPHFEEYSADEVGILPIEMPSDLVISNKKVDAFSNSTFFITQEKGLWEFTEITKNRAEGTRLTYSFVPKQNELLALYREIRKTGIEYFADKKFGMLLAGHDWYDRIIILSSAHNINLTIDENNFPLYYYGRLRKSRSLIEKFVFDNIEEFASKLNITIDKSLSKTNFFFNIKITHFVHLERNDIINNQTSVKMFPGKYELVIQMASCRKIFYIDDYKLPKRLIQTFKFDIEIKDKCDKNITLLWKNKQIQIEQ